MFTVILSLSRPQLHLLTAHHNRYGQKQRHSSPGSTFHAPRIVAQYPQTVNFYEAYKKNGGATIRQPR